MNSQVIENTKVCCSTPQPSETHLSHPQESENDLRPLIVILSYIVGGVFLKAVLSADFSLASLMRDGMGFFFVIFSMFKLFHLQGFATAFSTYDLVAARHRAYALAYPFLELLLGVLYLSRKGLFLADILTVIIMSVGSIGVFQALRRGSKIQCACLGSVLKLPMTIVTLVEDVAMGVMALFMLLS